LIGRARALIAVMANNCDITNKVFSVRFMTLRECTREAIFSRGIPARPGDCLRALYRRRRKADNYPDSNALAKFRERRTGGAMTGKWMRTQLAISALQPGSRLVKG
jgi:hypothetical protein